MYEIKMNTLGCKDLRDLGNYILRNNIRLVLFGEFHGFFGQLQVQRTILKAVKPDFFLYEMLEEDKLLNSNQSKAFLNKPNNEDFSFISNYIDLKPIVRLAHTLNLPIIGCDIKNMFCTSKGWVNQKFSREEELHIMISRENRQAKIINNYTPKGIVFAILGDYHVRRTSHLLSKLREEQAIVIRPGFKWKMRFAKKDGFKKSEVFYVVRHVKL